MTRKMVIGLLALTLSATGLTGMRSGWFCAAKPALSSTTTRDKEAAEAAARHCRCQPRHWRFLMLQQQP
jgi:hypothetical protein